MEDSSGIRIFAKLDDMTTNTSQPLPEAHQHPLFSSPIRIHTTESRVFVHTQGMQHLFELISFPKPRVLLIEEMEGMEFTVVTGPRESARYIDDIGGCLHFGVQVVATCAGGYWRCKVCRDRERSRGVGDGRRLGLRSWIK